MWNGGTSNVLYAIIIIFIHQYMVDMQKIIVIQQTKNLNNLTTQNVCVQYLVLQRYIFQTVCIYCFLSAVVVLKT